MKNRHTIALTPGDPSGIGIDLACQLIDQPPGDSRIVLICDAGLIAERAKLLGISGAVVHYQSDHSEHDQIVILDVQCSHPAAPGKPTPAHASYVLNSLDVAIEGCKRGEFDALVTGPVNKEMIAKSGIEFTGHTEYLAAKTGAVTAVMLLVSDLMRVSLVTVHASLAEVPDLVTVDRIKNVVKVLNNDLRTKFRIQSPKIAVCGLNPHAGEGGLLGSEEQRIISPAIEKLRAEGIDVRGPLPADTAFTSDNLAKCDVVLAMYHDQGLSVIKHSGFGAIANVTLGLPIVRTSVDHGTAYDLAGTGCAKSDSMYSAIKVAEQIVNNAKL